MLVREKNQAGKGVTGWVRWKGGNRKPREVYLFRREDTSGKEFAVGLYSPRGYCSSSGRMQAGVMQCWSSVIYSHLSKQWELLQLWKGLEQHATHVICKEPLHVVLINDFTFLDFITVRLA